MSAIASIGRRLASLIARRAEQRLLRELEKLDALATAASSNSDNKEKWS